MSEDLVRLQKAIEREKELDKILAHLHFEMCPGTCSRENLFVDVHGGKKRCLGCLGLFDNKRV